MITSQNKSTDEQSYNTDVKWKGWRRKLRFRGQWENGFRNNSRYNNRFRRMTPSQVCKSYLITVGHVASVQIAAIYNLC